MLLEGEIFQFYIGLKGIMNVFFFKDLVDKIWCGLCGCVEQGCFGGGKCYGYDVILGEEKGGRIINEVEVVIVKWICSEYVVGKFLKVIVVQFNREGVVGLLGKVWGLSIIYGNWDRGIGIINNEFYIGCLIWNCLCYVKDFQIGKCIFKLNDENDWIIQEVLDLWIIDEGFWQVVCCW